MARCFTKPDDFSGRDFYLDTDSGGKDIIRSKPDIVVNDQTGSNAPIAPLTPTVVPGEIADKGIVIEHWDDYIRYWIYDGPTDSWSVIKDSSGGGGGGSVITDSTLTGDGTPGNPLSVDKTGDWTGTFDGQDGSYYLDYNNLINTPSAISWSEITSATLNMDGNNGYVTNYGGGSRLTMTLPAVSSVGEVIVIVGKGGVGWEVTQGVGQRIYFEKLSTTAGAGTYLSSSHFSDVIELVCITANSEWRVTRAVSACINIT